MTVHLVGAGPGDPELLTVKAVRLIGEADVIVHDYLSNDSILELAKPGTEFIDVGKKPGNPTPQELINALLVHLGAQGKNVVRLKGGDPFVFGRGGEEAQALMEARIPFTVVPGITSASPIRRTAFTVRSSGSPGPAPTRCTVIALFPLRELPGMSYQGLPLHPQ